MAVFKTDAFNNYDVRVDELIPEKDKLDLDYLKRQCDYSINSLVNLQSKEHIQQAYDLYNMVRDESEFSYLEDNEGVGNACDLKFIPLIRKHIQVLVGQMLTNPLNYMITCKDEKSLEQVEREKMYKKLEEVFSRTIEQIQSNLAYLEKLKKLGVKGATPPKNKLSEIELKKLEDHFESHFQSEIEIAAQDILNYLLKSRTVDFKGKLETLFTDLLITGSCYYRGTIDTIGEDPTFEVINPRDIFYRKNTNDRYIKNCTRIVHRFQRTKQELLNQYGHMLSEEDKRKLFDGLHLVGYGKQYDILGREYIPGVSRSYDETTAYNANSYYSDYSTMLDQVVTCYHVEFIANNVVEITDADEIDRTITYENQDKTPKSIKRYRLDRYSILRIGTDIYAEMGRSRHVIRSQERPYYCNLSYNGVSFSDRNGKPYSLVLATKDLQDKYDLYHFYRDNVVANSGVKGNYVDVSMLPTFLGDEPEDRLVAWQAYIKQGSGVIDTSQEGGSDLNTIYKGFDNTLSYDAIRAYNDLIRMIEDTATSITGVTREMLAQIETRDAVSNVQVGLKQGALIVKPLFFLSELLIKEILTDLLDLSKIAYAKGKKGAYITGEARRKVFTLKPNQIALSDFDIHVSDSGDEVKDLDTIKQVTMELVKAKAMTADAAFRTLKAKSLTRASEIATEDATKQEEKMDALGNAQQQVQQLEQQLNELNSQLQKLQSTKTETDQIKIQLLQQKQAAEQELKNRELDLKERTQLVDEDYKRDLIELEKAQAVSKPTGTDDKVNHRVSL